MIGLRSIRAKSVDYTLIAVVVPLLILGTVGTTYYHNVIQEDIHSEGGKSYKITILDNGFGIPDSVKQTLFARFRQGPTMLPGRGLDMYAIKAIVEKFGGSLQIEDREPGEYTRGSMVVITLPVAEAK